MSAVQRKLVSSTATVFSHPVRVRGVQLTAGTSVTLYGATSATGDPVVVAISAGTVQELPGCGVEVPALHAVSAGSGAAIVYYD